ncbi:MAG: helix-turn-helix domain-containing protein [Nocardioides sp.]|nr:helix-turn-helix domain-containing protein [Nocardioides sp.]
MDLTVRAADVSDPRVGLRAIAALRRLVDTLELRQVEAALAAGLGWTDIADCLGVSRQAVHKKYLNRVRPGLAPKHGGAR